MAASRHGRALEPDADPWTHNAWDNVEFQWNDERVQEAEKAISQQKAAPVPLEMQRLFNENPACYWDKLYSQVKDKMYQDKSWLTKEFDFASLAAALGKDATETCIVELGCGPGATFFPLVQQNANPNMQLVALDYSSEAIQILKSNELFKKHDNVTADVYDLSSDTLPNCVQPESADIVILVYVLSALHPTQWATAIKNILSMLKPGGILIFRDFGRYDLCQLRFRKERWMDDNLYVRGDGTRVYFFELEQVRKMMDNLVEDGQKLAEVTLDYDRRMLLNRKRRIQMYRVWLQGTWRKIKAA